MDSSESRESVLFVLRSSRDTRLMLGPGPVWTEHVAEALLFPSRRDAVNFRDAVPWLSQRHPIHIKRVGEK